MPPMYAMYVFSILKERGCTVNYTKILDKNKIENYDYIILTSSIICHETELKALQELNNQGKSFCYWNFYNVMKEKNINKIPI